MQLIRVEYFLQILQKVAPNQFKMRIGAIRITANIMPKIKLPINAMTLDITVYLNPSKYISMLFVNIEKSGTYSPLFL